MDIGIPKESKVKEGRVGLVPDACADLVKRGHVVRVETQAGVLSGFADVEYTAAGCLIAADFNEIAEKSTLIVKVKEPQAREAAQLKSHHTLFCYLHLAALPALTQQLQDSGATAVAFETVTDHQGLLPLLSPMSQIAGTLAIQNAAVQLHQPNGGAGILMGGLSATPRTHVVVLGCGSAGYASAQLAARMGAQVTVFDKIIEKLDSARQIGPNVTALYPYQGVVDQYVAAADVVVGAVLVPGAKAPMVISKAVVEQMAPGRVIVDIAIDQGGCIETIKPTDYSQPTYIAHDVIHFAVTNMPGAVPRTASQALSAAIAPYIDPLTKAGWESDAHLANGINVKDGNIVHPGLLHSIGQP